MMSRFFEFSKEEISTLIEACEDKIDNYHEAILSQKNDKYSHEYVTKMINKKELLQSILKSFEGK